MQFEENGGLFRGRVADAFPNCLRKTATRTPAQAGVQGRHKRAIVFLALDPRLRGGTTWGGCLYRSGAKTAPEPTPYPTSPKHQRRTAFCA